MFQVFRSRRMAAVTLLGFCSGLPFYLTNRNLQAWLTMNKISLTAIGLFSLVSLPYSLKFLWAPLIDRFSPPALGRRKGWIVAAQAMLVVAIATMALHDPSRSLYWLAINALALAFVSATQDVAIDAYRTDVLNADETAAGAGAFVLGYRGALILTGSGALILADHASWPAAYLALAAIMAGAMLASLGSPEPPIVAPPETLQLAVRMPFVDYFSRVGARRGALVLAFIVLFRLGDAMIANMTTPFLLQIGFTQTDVGAVQGGIGLLSTIVGVVAGGAVAARLGLFRSLWVFGAFQAFSNLAYVVLAYAGRNYPTMVATIVIENFCGGLGTSALVGFLMSLCNPRFSATQYALLSSMMAAGRDLLVAPAGALAERTGWAGFFWISFVAAFPALLFLPAITTTYQSGKKPAEQ
jgi:PAT family beta-lactamase induction signal transducer AmpG